MPTPSPEARAKSNAKIALGTSYMKDGKERFSIHIGNECSSCWIELTVKNSAGDGYCENCCAAKDLDAQRKFWTDDMNRFYDQQGYLERKAFDMDTRTFNKQRIKKYARI